MPALSHYFSDFFDKESKLEVKLVVWVTVATLNFAKSPDPNTVWVRFMAGNKLKMLPKWMTAGMDTSSTTFKLSKRNRELQWEPLDNENYTIGSVIVDEEDDTHLQFSDAFANETTVHSANGILTTKVSGYSARLKLVDR